MKKTFIKHGEKIMAVICMAALIQAAGCSHADKKNIKEISDRTAETLKSIADEKNGENEENAFCLHTVSDAAGLFEAELSGIIKDIKNREKAPVSLNDLNGFNSGDIIKKEQIDYDALEKYFTSEEISDTVFDRIYGDDRSYKTYCTVPREDLRYIKVLYVGFDEKIHVGEMIIHKDLASDICEIFTELFKAEYQINKMVLIDEYGADDMASIADNNTSAFNFRPVTGGTTLSYHGMGCAIDINPLNNPYVWYENGSLTWEDKDAGLYLDRNAEDAYERHMINHDDLCYQLFHEHGFTWGGDWLDPIDYQHFEKVVAYYDY